jgi:hypothetical protein
MSDYDWHHDPPPEPGAENEPCAWCAKLGVERKAYKMLGASGICFDCYETMSLRVARRDERTVWTLADALDALTDALRRFVAWPSEHHPRVVALWIAHTHFIDAFETTPRLAVLSPVKGSGKTRVLELLEASCAGPMFAVNLSPSALFRRLDKGGATLLLDEADTHLGKSSAKSSEKYEDLRALVNAGYRAGAKVYRSEPTGKTVIEREFNVFAPVAVAGIGDLPDTILDRSIVVPMRRRSPRERVERYRIRVGKNTFGPIRDVLEALAPLCVDQLAEARPELPDGIEDRSADCWEPLIAVADLAEGQWPQWARTAAVELNRLRVERAPSLAEQLLVDCHRVFAELDAKKRKETGDPRATVDRIASGDLATELCRLDDAPWADLHGSMLDARSLARRLRNFDVRPDKIRVGPKDGDTVRGYKREWFVDPWDRYLPPPLPTRQQAEQAEQTEQAERDQAPAPTDGVPDVPDVPDVPVSAGMGETADPTLFDGYVPPEEAL